MLISSIFGGPTLIGRSVGAASMLSGFSGAGRFKGSLKCSTHPFRCSSMLVITLPYLLFTGRSGLRRFPESFFVMSYSCLMFPSLAAFSAVVAISSTYLRLSVLMLLFTCLFTSKYSSCALAFSTLVRLHNANYSTKDTCCGKAQINNESNKSIIQKNRSLASMDFSNAFLETGLKTKVSNPVIVQSTELLNIHHQNDHFDKEIRLKMQQPIITTTQIHLSNEFESSITNG
ncbi:unnamed protein product [Schistosoma curassoni]|uniref:Uncharacterized protein n=1 Tax=Schistosoma curassoni TaxID=6186 RepID=A0A183KP89_9TREM|nr:unnamed protein product [Schistosoma curassoni]